MHFTRGVRLLFGGMTGIVLAFLYLPLAIIVVLSFNTVSSLSWPPKGFTLHWWQSALHSTGARDALWVSLKTATGATAVALVLGLLASLAVHRFKFFGRESLNLMIVLPIALPGIVTGIALNAAFRQAGFELGLTSLIVAHATFCIVVLYNNLLARLRRLSPNLEEASADLGAHTFQTFRYITFPLLRTALLAGGLLAFGLSFDEIVVTTFTAGAGLETLPIWIFKNLSRGEQQPIVTVVATSVMLLSIIPVWIALRLTSDDGPMTGGTR
jgi:putative spermidine/putrescine transport system permease protein